MLRVAPPAVVMSAYDVGPLSWTSCTAVVVVVVLKAAGP